MLSLLIGLLNIIWLIFIVAIAIGFILFVHELGHFLVAKMCGVRCDKFYLGFDIGGLKLCKFRWGETEYGIGILPWGGYVKMLGQEDNPAQIRAEIERAKIQGDTKNASDTAAAHSTTSPAAEKFNLEAAEKVLYDPRSYLAKSVPKRMAIISAGVIMNVIFAFLMAIWAYYIGVEQITCGVGDIMPGEAAWRAGLRPGDQIEEIAGKKTERFEDLLKSVTTGDIENGLKMLVKRPGVKEPIELKIYPDALRGRPTIGVLSSRTTTLAKNLPDDIPPFLPGSAAAQAKPVLQRGDRIVMIDGQTVDNIQQLNARLAEHPDKVLQLMVECMPSAEDKKHGDVSTAKLVEVTVPPQPMQSLGLVMTMGEIAAVQQGSPAAAAGIKAHDRIVKIDGQAPGDPMRLPDQLQRRAGQTLTFTIDREGLATPIDIPVTLRKIDWIEQPQMENNPISVPELGIAYKVLNRVDQVLPGSPAEKAGVKPGEMIRQATIYPPEPSTIQGESIQNKLALTFDENKSNWPFFFYEMQKCYPTSKVELVLDNDHQVKLHLEKVTDWFNPERGFIFAPDTKLKKADSLAQAISFGGEETWESLTLVVRVLRKLGSQISVKELSGPISIAVMAGQAAKKGLSTLLLFLTLLSANLAVLNLLPIPMLDGGHLIFLTYEGVRGKPADERLQIGLSVLGFAFLIGLMLFVLGMDFFRLLFFFSR